MNNANLVASKISFIKNCYYFCYTNDFINYQQVPDRDSCGNIIPDWKRQMLAKKAAEKAKKEFEDRLAREAEDRRLSAIPKWKRDLIARKEEAECKMK